MTDIEAARVTTASDHADEPRGLTWWSVPALIVLAFAAAMWVGVL